MTPRQQDFLLQTVHMHTRPNTLHRQIRLFSAIRIESPHGAHVLTSDKARSLLAYLVLRPRAPHRREALADLLFADAPPDRARRNLSDVLHRLRKTLGDGWLNADAEGISLRTGDDLFVDVWAFDALAASDKPGDLQRAIALYDGELAPELYDDWIASERENRRIIFVNALEKEASRLEAGCELQEALHHLRRLLLVDPLHEPANHAYLRLLGRLRRHGEAQAHYEAFRQRLRLELGAEPMSDTRDLVHALMRERDPAGLSASSPESAPFVGRLAERAAALDAVDNVLRKRGAVLAIEGVPGIGKSRLAQEICAGARWRGVTVAQGGVSEVPHASPFAPLAGALAPVLTSRAAQLEAILPAESLAMLAVLHPAWNRTQPEAAMLQPSAVAGGQASRQLHGALRALGAAIAQLTPVMLVLDDMQWASPTLWESVQALSQGFAQHGGLLVVIYRRPEIERTFGWDMLQAWGRAGVLQTLSLQPFNTDEVAQLIHGLAHMSPVEAHALTGGNPFLLTEWLAEPETGKTAWQYRGLVERRLQALAPQVLRALECAAVLGEHIPYRLWADVADMSPLALAASCDVLIAQRWLRATAVGHAFAHDLVRQTVYQTIEPDRRRSLHARAATVYHACEPENAHARAYHYERADMSADAATAYRLAGAQDRARLAFREAHAALERAMRLTSSDPSRIRIETALSLADICESTGHRESQRAALDEALAGASRLNDDALLLQGLLISGYALDQTGQLDAAEAQLREALVLARQLKNAADETYAIFLLGDCCIQRGQWSQAQTYCEQALTLARRHVNPALEGKSLRGLAMAARQTGAPHDAVRWFEQALSVHRNANDRWSEMATRVNLLSAYYDLGAWDQLMAEADVLLRMASDYGEYSRLANVQHLKGLAAYSLGEHEEAHRLFSLAEAQYAAGGQRRMAGLLRNTLGLVAEDVGDDAEALRCYRAALDNALTLQAATEAAYAQHDLGALLLRMEQPAEAIPLLEASAAYWLAQRNELLRVKSEAYLGLAVRMTGDEIRAADLAAAGLDVFSVGVPVGEQPQGWLWALYRLLVQLGGARVARAPDVLRAAYAELQRQAKAIADGVRRRSFFERVPLNRAIVNAHDTLLSAAREVLSVALARQGVPLGRSLRPDEFVTVQWTARAPDDDAISDKSARRRHRLQRLLREAEAQGAAPTDEDLARALGVSRRTVLRDMLALGTMSTTASTRKRRRSLSQ